MRTLPLCGGAAAASRPGRRRSPNAAWAALVLVVAVIPGVALATPPGFAFLQVPSGARASALGGAYTSLATGAEAAFWNPAGLDATRGTEIVASHFEMYEKLRHDQFAVAGRLFGCGVSGSVRALYSEPIEQRDALGNLTGSFGSDDIEMALGLGHRVTSGLTAGGTFAVVHERIANLSASTFSFGAGLAWEPAALQGARMSLAAQNLGPAAHYIIDGAPGAPVQLPAGVQGGVSYALPFASSYTLRTALEARMTRGQPGVAMLGGELAAGMGAAVRVGFRLNDTNSQFGAGVGYATRALHLDYAYVPSGLDIGDTHRFSLSTRF